MQLKYPKKIKILNDEFTVTYDKVNRGGDFDFSKGTMRIGLDKTTAATFEIMCHEVMEAIHIITCTRYTESGTAQDYKFFQTHKEFQVAMYLFTHAIEQFIK